MSETTAGDRAAGAAATSDRPQLPLGYGTLYAQEGGYRPRVVVTVEGAGMLRVVSRPPMGEYLRRLWQRRHFIVADSRARVESSNRVNILGSVWLVLNPLLSGVVYFVIFGLVLQGRRGIDNFPGYLIIGVFMFQFTIRCLTQGSRSISGGKSLIRAFSFPRASLPVAMVLRETLKFIPALITMLVLIIAIPYVMPLLDPGGEPLELRISWLWLLFPGVLVLQLVLNLGIALLAARVTAKIPDLTQVISIFARFWLYGSAVFFSIDRFDAVPALQTIMRLNPMYLVLDIARDLLLYATAPSWMSWALLSAWSAGVLVAGAVYFWRGEETYGSS